jgi:mannose/fructose/N-acetylgalactosamine-specific phosphotransferase system component IIC
MLPEPGALVVLVLFGTWVGIDSTTVGQFMISRPVVSATLAGLIAGDAAAGALVGLVLEAINITVLPVGAARYPEIGPPAVVAGAVYAVGPQTGSTLITAVLFALGSGWIGGITVRWLRQSNSRLTQEIAVTEDPARLLERRHYAAIAFDALRAASLVVLGFPLLAALTAATYWGWQFPPGVARAVIWAVVGASVAATIPLFGGKRVPFFAAGLLCGLLLILV